MMEELPKLEAEYGSLLMRDSGGDRAEALRFQIDQHKWRMDQVVGMRPEELDRIMTDKLPKLEADYRSELIREGKRAEALKFQIDQANWRALQGIRHGKRAQAYRIVTEELPKLEAEYRPLLMKEPSKRAEALQFEIDQAKSRASLLSILEGDDQPERKRIMTEELPKLEADYRSLLMEEPGRTQQAAPTSAGEMPPQRQGGGRPMTRQQVMDVARKVGAQNVRQWAIENGFDPDNVVD